MSELINNSFSAKRLRHHLLANVSMLVLLGHFGAAQASQSDDQPTVWIDLGGQAEKVDSGHLLFAPAFLSSTPEQDVAPMIAAQRPSRYSIGGEGKITFDPVDSNWVLSAAVRYGRSQNARHSHQQTPLPYLHQVFGTQIILQPSYQQFGDGQTELKESHFILDFQAGKDVGLGLFGAHGKSTVSVGVRFAQFTSATDIVLHARPENRVGDVHFGSRSLYRSYPEPHYTVASYRTYDFFRRTNAASLQAQRSTHAVGPSLSWDASVPVVGNGTDMTLDFDWGLKAAVLFGRQRVRTHHQTTGHYYSKTGGQFKYHTTPDGLYTRGNTVRQGGYTHGPFNRTSSRMVTIPNIGGSIGLTLKFPNAKFTLGYRADLFFNATDNGIDARHEVNQNYFGPYASISIGFP